MSTHLGLPPDAATTYGRGLPRTVTRDPAALDRASAPGLAPEGGAAETGEAGFGDLLSGLVRDVDQRAKDARTKADDLAAGRSHDIHGTMIAVETASVSMRLLGSVRNRALEAYREVMRMGA